MQVMVGNNYGSYTFNASTGVITLSGLPTPLAAIQVKLIVNAKTNTIIFNLADPTQTATISGNTIALSYNTSGMNNSDPLQIFMDVPGEFVTQGQTTIAPLMTAIAGITGDGTPKYMGIPLTPNGVSVKVDGSGVTQPVSGTVGISSVGGTVDVSEQITQIAGYVPDPSNSYVSNISTPIVDVSGSLATRGLILTDEGSFRDEFTGASLVIPLTGTVTFTHGSTTVTGVGTLFTSQVSKHAFLKKTADSETLYVSIASINSDTSLTLVTPYLGATGTSSAIISNWETTTGVGGSITVSSSNINLVAGVGNGSITGVQNGHRDYLPLMVEFYLSINQTIANQNIVFGLQDVLGPSAVQEVTVQLSGTNGSVGYFVTSSGGTVNDTDYISFVFPNNSTSLEKHKYRIGLSGNRSELSIDDIVVATNTIHIPLPYTPLFPVLYLENTGITSSSTTVTCDYMFLCDVDRIQIDNQFDEPLPFSINGPFRTNNVASTVTPYNALRATSEAHQLFYDTFDTSLDTTERWIAISGNGGSNPSSGGYDSGATSLNPGTTVNGYSLLQSKAQFPLTIPGYLKSHWSINLDYPITLNNYRFWGLGNTLAEPTLTTPLVDAVGFEVGIDGKLYAVCYAGNAGVSSTRNLIADLSPTTGSGQQPIDSNAHIYYTWFAGFKAYWAIDTLENIVATLSTGEMGPNNNTMAMTAISISNGTSGNFILNGTSLGDTAHNSVSITDSAYPWRKASIAEAGASADSTDNALVVALSPTTPLPAGTNVIGTVDINSGQSISVVQGTTPWEVTGVMTGTVVTNPPTNATTNLSQYGGVNVSQSNPVWVGVTDGIHSLPTGDTSARPIHASVDNTVAVSGTVIVSNSFALDSTITGGSAKTQVTDGTNTVFTSTHPAYVQGTVNTKIQDGSGNLITSTGNALDINIKSGGGTTQYTSGVIQTTPTGTVAMGQNPSNAIKPLQLDSNGYLEVNVVGGITVTGGSFTAASDGPTGTNVPLNAAFMGYRNSSGILTGVGTTTPLPITGSIATSDPSVGVIGATTPTDASLIGFNSGGNLATPSLSTPLPVLAIGGHTDNSAAPSTDNLGVLPAVVSYNPPVRTNGDLATLSIDVAGALRTRTDTANPLGDGVSMPRQNQVEVNFSLGFNPATVTNTLTGSAIAVVTNGTSIYSTGTTENSRAVGCTTQQLDYHPGHSWYAYFTAAFTPGGPAGSWQRIGSFNATDGFYLGYEDSVLTFTHLQNGNPTHISIDSWNGDPIDGSVNSRFTSGGNPVALDTTKINIFRIHGAWFGASPIALDTFSPDGNWINLHTFRFPNTLTTPFMYTTDLNFQVDVNNAATTTNLTVTTPCWAMGVINQASSSDIVKADAGIWDNSTENNSSIIIYPAFDAGSVTIGLVQTTTITGGTVEFQASEDNINWYVVNGINLQTQLSSSTYNFQANTNAMFVFDLTGRAYFRLYLVSPIVGTGQVTVQYGITDSLSSTVQVSGEVVIYSLPGQAIVGNSVPANSIMVAGTDGTNARNLLVDTSGRLQDNISQVAGVSLGSTAIVNYGSTPSSVPVPAVNAYVTNTIPVSQSGNWTTRIVGNSGAVVDVATGSASQAGNLIQVGGWVTGSNPAYSTATQNTFSLTPSGGVRTDHTSVAGTALTAVPSTFGAAPTGSVQGVNASLFAGTTSVPSGTLGTSPGAVTGALPTNASLFLGTTAMTTTGTAGQPLVGAIPYYSGTPIDPRQTRALTSSDQITIANSNIPVTGTVTTNQGTAAAGAKWSVQVDNSSAISVVDSASETSLSTIAGAVTSSKMQVNITNASIPITDTTLATTIVSSGSTTQVPMVVVAGQTNDATPQYQEIPLTAGGASVKVDGSATTQPVSLSGQAVSIQSSGTALTNTGGALNVNVTGGVPTNTQYIDGATVATPTGTVVLGQNVASGTVQALQTDPNGNLLISSLDGTVLDTQTSITSIGPGATYNVGGYGYISLQFAGIWAGVIKVEGSNDGVNWIQQYVQYLGSGYISDVIQIPTIVQVVASSIYLRYNVIQLETGTITAKVVGNTGTIPTTSLLGMSFDTASGVTQNVSVSNINRDVNNSLIPSDAPGPITIGGFAGQVIIIDTQGYQTLQITTENLVANVYASNDKVGGANSWSSLYGVFMGGNQLVNSLMAASSYIFPCSARFVKFVVGTAGSAILYLRNQPFVGAYNTGGSVNIAQVNGSTIATTGGVVVGVLPVGGPLAPGAAATVNPIGVSGVDATNLTRRLLTDTTGRLLIPSIDQSNISHNLGSISPNNTMQNVAPLAVEDLTQYEGQSIVELLAQILIELKINNQYLFELPRLLTTGTSNSTSDEPGNLRNDPSISTIGFA
jgi:hypothetical protein